MAPRPLTGAHGSTSRSRRASSAQCPPSLTLAPVRASPRGRRDESAPPREGPDDTDASFPTLSADEIGSVLRFVGADDLARLARVSREFHACARAAAPEVWVGIDAELRELLCQFIPGEDRWYMAIQRVCSLRNTPSESGVEDPDEHMDRIIVAFEEAADGIVRIANRVREILWTQAAPLACLLPDARLPVLFATAALRLLHNPWRTAGVVELWSRYCPDEPGLVFPSPEGVAWQAAKDASRISLGLLQQAELEASAEFAQSLAPDRARLFLRYRHGVTNGDEFLTNAALVTVMDQRLGGGLGEEWHRYVREIIAWDHLETRASREGALGSSVVAPSQFPEQIITSNRLIRSWMTEYCYARRSYWDPLDWLPVTVCPFCCDCFHSPGFFGTTVFHHMYDVHKLLSRVLLPESEGAAADDATTRLERLSVDE